MELSVTVWAHPPYPISGDQHFYCIEEHMTVWPLNAAHINALPGCKSDVRDAEWIAQPLEHGLSAARDQGRTHRGMFMTD